MYTRSSKAQGIIGEIILFGIIIFLSIFIFILLSSQDNAFQEKASQEIETSVGSVNQRSLLTALLNDQVWRDPEISKGKYDELTALQLSSYYFSTSEDLRIYDKTIARQELKADLRSYYNYKLKRNFRNRPEPISYGFNITDGEDYIDLTEFNDVDGQWYSTSVPLQLSNDTGEITLWTRGTGGVFDVE